MTQAVVKAAPQAVMEWSTDEEKVLRATVAPDLAPAEFALFARVCAHSQLDPFKREIYAIKRGGKMTIQTGIDGYRLIALRSGRYGGSESFWCGPDGMWMDVWLDPKTAPAAAKVIVRSKDGGEYVGVATFSEYCQRKDGQPTGLWKQMPANMLAKCAEAQALRKACPGEFEGIYVDAEMDQSANVAPARQASRRDAIEAGKAAAKQGGNAPQGGAPEWLVELREQIVGGWGGNMADFGEMLGTVPTVGAWKTWAAFQEDAFKAATDWYRENKMTPAEQAMEAAPEEAPPVEGDFTELANAALELPFD